MARSRERFIFSKLISKKHVFTCSCADQVKSDSLFSKEVDQTELDLAFKSVAQRNESKRSILKTRFKVERMQKRSRREKGRDAVAKGICMTRVSIDTTINGIDETRERVLCAQSSQSISEPWTVPAGIILEMTNN